MANKCEFKSLPDAKSARNRTSIFSFDYNKITISDTLKKFAKGKTYFIHTYGCQANYRDEEVIAGMLEMMGYKKASKIEDADFILLNTCAVRENAEQKVYGQIGNLKALKQANKEKVIAICGCMVQQEHIIKFIIDTFKHVDLIFGTHNIDEFPSMLEEVITKKIRLVNVKSLPDKIKEELPSVRLSSFKAFVNISYGCDKFCT